MKMLRVSTSTWAFKLQAFSKENFGGIAAQEGSELGEGD
jgi:hypothetical protein